MNQRKWIQETLLPPLSKYMEELTATYSSNGTYVIRGCMCGGDKESTCILFFISEESNILCMAYTENDRRNIFRNVISKEVENAKKPMALLLKNTSKLIRSSALDVLWEPFRLENVDLIMYSSEGLTYGTSDWNHWAFKETIIDLRDNGLAFEYEKHICNDRNEVIITKNLDEYVQNQQQAQIFINQMKMKHRVMNVAKETFIDYVDQMGWDYRCDGTIITFNAYDEDETFLKLKCSGDSRCLDVMVVLNGGEQPSIILPFSGLESRDIIKQKTNRIMATYLKERRLQMRLNR